MKGLGLLTLSELELQQSPLKNHIKQGLLRYCRALDLHDAEPLIAEHAAWAIQRIRERCFAGAAVS